MTTSENNYLTLADSLVFKLVQDGKIPSFGGEKITLHVLNGRAEKIDRNQTLIRRERKRVEAEIQERIKATTTK